MAHGPWICVGLGGGVSVCIDTHALNTTQRAEALAAAETLAGLMGGTACLTEDSCC